MESENTTLGNKPQEWTPDTVFELMSKELGHPAYVAVANAHNAALAAANEHLMRSQHNHFECQQELLAEQEKNWTHTAVARELESELAAERECDKRLVEALRCAEYAMTHPASDQKFALNAVRDAISGADALAKETLTRNQESEVKSKCEN